MRGDQAVAVIDPPRPIERLPDLDEGLRGAPAPRPRRDLQHQPLLPDRVVIEHRGFGVQATDPVEIQPPGNRPPHRGALGHRPLPITFEFICSPSAGSVRPPAPSARFHPRSSVAWPPHWLRRRRESADAPEADGFPRALAYLKRTLAG